MNKFTAIQIAKIIIPALALLFAAMKYMDHRSERMVNRSYELIKRYQKGVIYFNTEKTNSAWDDGLHSEFIVLSNRDKSKKAYEKFITNAIKKQALEIPISSIMDFYEDTVKCVNLGNCDKKTINEYFMMNGRIFFTKYYPFICNQRKRSRDPTMWKKFQEYYNPDHKSEEGSCLESSGQVDDKL